MAPRDSSSVSPNKVASQGPQTTLILSRSGYRVGGTLVGTLLIEKGQGPPLRQLQGVDVVVVGYCRLDARWHKTPTPYPLPPRQVQTKELYATLPKAENLFWTSACIDLLPLPTLAENVSQRPKDLLVPAPLPVADTKALNTLELSEDVTIPDVTATNAAKTTFLSYSFRLDLPPNLPPSISATSCRYAYAILHRLRFQGQVAADVPWKELPFSILTADIHTEGTTHESLQTSMPALHAVSHGDTLLCTLTSTEVHNRSGQGHVTVHTQGAAMFRSVRLSDACQTMRVSDPSGAPVAVLTVLGATQLSPGSRLLLQLDFPNPEKPCANWVPCYQASACLQGEEMVLPRPTKGSAPKRRRARQLLLATAHEILDPDCAERVCLNLLVPADAPCSVQTDVVEISLWCVVDLTVGTSSRSDTATTKSKAAGHHNLRLEIPCRMGHPRTAVESEAAEGDYHEDVNDDMDESVDSLASPAIRQDLRRLSYAVLEHARSMA